MPAVPTDQPWVPDLTQLTGNLSYLRRLLDNRAPRLASIKELVRVARLLSPTPSDLDGVLAAVQLGINHMPGDELPPVAERLYGLTEDSSGLPLKDRRALAYRKYLDFKPGYSDESFRTGPMQDIAEDLAVALVELVVAHNERPAPNGENDVTGQAAVADQQAETPEQDELPQGYELGVVAPDEQSVEPVEASPELDPESAPRTWVAVRRVLHRRAPALLAIAGIAALGTAAALVSDHDRSGAPVVSGGCGPTAVQFYNKPTSGEPASGILVYAPAEERAVHGWAGYIPIPPSESEKTETFRYGEVRQFALVGTNETSETEHDLIARVGLPQTAKLEPNTTCIYRNSNYTSGTHYTGTGLIAPGGIKIGSLAPKQEVYVTFKERLPTVGHAGNTATMYGAIAPESKIGGPEWIYNSSRFELELIGGA
jgi:hypothetical protein